MAQCDMRKYEIQNLQLFSEIVESFQPLGVSPDFTTGRTRNHGIKSCAPVP